jgi:hypothetical protein
MVSVMNINKFERRKRCIIFVQIVEIDVRDATRDMTRGTASRDART